MRVRGGEPGSGGRSARVPRVSQPPACGVVEKRRAQLGFSASAADIPAMIIKLIQSKANAKRVERYARYLASYMADGDRRWLKPDAIGMDYGLTLSAYMSRTSNTPEPPRDRVLYRAAQVGGHPFDWDTGLEEVERRLKRRSRKVKKPVRHSVISCRAGERLTEQGCIDAVAVLAKELDCEDAAILWAAHIDTDNFHLHVMFVTVDPATGDALPFGQGDDGRAAYKEAMQRSIARIEHAQNLQSEVGARYEMQGGNVVRKPTLERSVRKRTTLRRETLAWEQESGFASFTRFAQDVAGPILDDSVSWSQLHAQLAPHGLGVRPAVNGGELYAGDEHVKLSNVDRRHSWKKLKDRLGTFEPPVGIDVAPYTPVVLDAEMAQAWLERSRLRRELSARIETRVAALLESRAAVLAETNANLSAHRADLAGFDGDPRLRRDLATAWPRLRALTTASIMAAFNGRIEAVRAMRHAAATFDDIGAIDLGAIGEPDAGIVDLSFVVAPQPSVAVLPGFEAERRGTIICYWSRDDLARRGQPALVDTGVIVWVNDSSDRAVEAALTLTHTRFGRAAVFGDAAYIAQCERAARRLGIEIETITLAEAMRRAHRARRGVEEARKRAADLQVGQRDESSSLQRWARAYRRAMSTKDLAAWQQEPVRFEDLTHHTALPTRTSDPAIRPRTSDRVITRPDAPTRAFPARSRDGGGID